MARRGYLASAAGHEGVAAVVYCNDIPVIAPGGSDLPCSRGL